MKISEVIAHLEALKKRHGDLVVYFASYSHIDDTYGYEFDDIHYEEEICHPDYDSNRCEDTVDPGIYLV